MVWNLSRGIVLLAAIAVGTGLVGSTATRFQQAATGGSPSPSAVATVVPAGDRTAVAVGSLGDRDPSSGRVGSDRELPDGTVQSRDWGMAMGIEMSDPRLSGSLEYVSNNGDTLGWPGRGGFGVGWGTWRLAGPDGTWVGDYTKASRWDAEPGASAPADPAALAETIGWTETAWLVGEGAYAGMSAWLQVDWTPGDDGTATRVTALILPGSPPPDRD